MSPAELDRYFPLTAAGAYRWGQTTRLALQLIYCDGLPAAEAGRRCRISRQAVRNKQAMLEREMRRQGGYPDDWEVVVEVVPPDVAEKIRALSGLAYDAHFRP